MVPGTLKPVPPSLFCWTLTLSVPTPLLISASSTAPVADRAKPRSKDPLASAMSSHARSSFATNRLSMLGIFALLVIRNAPPVLAPGLIVPLKSINPGPTRERLSI